MKVKVEHQSNVIKIHSYYAFVILEKTEQRLDLGVILKLHQASNLQTDKLDKKDYFRFLVSTFRGRNS